MSPETGTGFPLQNSTATFKAASSFSDHFLGTDKEQILDNVIVRSKSSFNKPDSFEDKSFELYAINTNQFMENVKISHI